MNYAAEDLRARGMVVWNIEYRGADQAGGGYPGTYLDVAAAADACAASPGPSPRSRQGGRGRPFGRRHLGAWLAARPRLPAHSPLARRDPLPVSAVVNLGGLPDLKADKRRPTPPAGPISSTP